jgi:hypothetical protein
MTATDQRRSLPKNKRTIAWTAFIAILRLGQRRAWWM